MKTAVARLSRTIAARRALVDGRREHDDAMAIPRVATRARHAGHACPRARRGRLPLLPVTG